MNPRLLARAWVAFDVLCGTAMIAISPFARTTFDRVETGILGVALLASALLWLPMARGPK